MRGSTGWAVAPTRVVFRDRIPEPVITAPVDVLPALADMEYY